MKTFHATVPLNVIRRRPWTGWRTGWAILTWRSISTRLADFLRLGTASPPSILPSGTDTFVAPLAVFRIRKCLGHPDKSLFVRIQILPSTSKNVWKTRISNILLLPKLKLLYLKINVKIPTSTETISKKMCNFCKFFVMCWKPLKARSGSVTKRHGSRNHRYGI
jgi:hypothetical protein